MPKAETITLNTTVAELPLVGTTLTKAFASVGVLTVADLLYYFPTRYMDYRKTVSIGAAVEGDVVTIIGRVKSVRANLGFRGRMSYAEAVLEDGTGKIRAIWFNQSYIAKQIKVGDDIILSGQVGRYKQLQLTNPAYEMVEGKNIHTGRLVPVYRRSDLIPLRTVRRLVQLSLPAAEELEDLIPPTLAKTNKVMPLSKAIHMLHFPESEDDIAQARFRIAVDDILPQQLAVQLRKQARENVAGFAIKPNIDQVKAFLKTLPFELTASQKRATWDILQDIEPGPPMNRLLQGDVGSGKTIVAILAAMQTVGAGFQTAVLAPTEILAKQHYDTFQNFLSDKVSGIALLTRTFALLNGQAVTRTELIEKIANGQAKICIGTHALLQGDIVFQNLALLIIDEQHRFGVGQRSFLVNGNAHLLSMSATPIPRTLAMSLYGDLEVSTLTHVLSGRKPVKTTVVAEANRQQAYDFIKSEVAAGRQAFIVTPRVEDTQKNELTSEVRSVKKEFARLQSEVFPKMKLGLLYGKMKGAEKDKVMAEFAAGELDVLVATSVIEIGIDIPKATAMIIEGSERFGLAQLHQLRGRIGRNDFDCRCFLFTTVDSQRETARLKALASINNGFALAELDLKERGFGDLFGKQQSGFVFRFPQFISIKALGVAKSLAEALFKLYPNLDKIPKLKAQAQAYLVDLHDE